MRWIRKYARFQNYNLHFCNRITCGHELDIVCGAAWSVVKGKNLWIYTKPLRPVSITFWVLCIQVSVLCGPEGLSGGAFSLPLRFLLEHVILFACPRNYPAFSALMLFWTIVLPTHMFFYVFSAVIGSILFGLLPFCVVVIIITLWISIRLYTSSWINPVNCCFLFALMFPLLRCPSDSYCESLAPSLVCFC